MDRGVKKTVSASIVVYIWIAALALSNTTTQAMQPTNNAIVAMMSDASLAGLTDVEAKNPLRAELIEVPTELASENKIDLTTPYYSSSLECVDGCLLSVLPKYYDSFASLVTGPILLGPAESDGCVVVLDLPSRQSTRGRHWWLCLVGLPERHLKMRWKNPPTASLTEAEVRHVSQFGRRISYVETGSAILRSFMPRGTP